MYTGNKALYTRTSWAGRPSNHDKKEAFLEFVDTNTQPNGRQAGSYSAQYPKFTRIATPKQGEKNYDQVQSLVVSQLKFRQREGNQPVVTQQQLNGLRSTGQK